MDLSMKSGAVSLRSVLCGGLLVLAAGCSAPSPATVTAEMQSDTTTPRPNPTTTTTTTTVHRTTTTTPPDEKQFLLTVTKSATGVYPDADLLSFGYSMCDSMTQIGATGTLQGLIRAATKTGFGGHDAGLILAAAAGSLCPEHLDALVAAADRLLSP